MDETIEIAAQLVKKFEGCSLKPYLCPAQIWTIGFGNTISPDGKPVTELTKPITQEEAESLLKQTLNVVQNQIRHVLQRSLNPYQEAALISFTYNLGIGRLAESTLLKCINSGQMAKAAKEFLRWNKAGGRVLNGLTRRRQAEQDLFLKNTEIQ